MTESITIEYQPLLSGNIFHKRNLMVTPEELYGIIIMANIITTSDNITIKSRDGNVIDTGPIHTLPYLNNKFEYTYKIGSPGIEPYDVSSTGLDLIHGASQVCILFGRDPSSIITDIKYMKAPITIDFGKYYGQLSIYNFTEYPDGSAIDVDDVKYIVSPILIDSLSKSLNECFPDSVAGMIVPSEFYMITSDANRDNVIASVSACTNLPQSLGEYANISGYYIYNVCSNTDHRGQGLAKSIIITMLNDLYIKGANMFILEVLDSNIIAYTLYISLGFIKISSSYEEDKTYDVLYLAM